ncbi:hypothetical protein K435DRAFT_969443 [Dendrothele bispora CBS 962.96]|uniref:Uncharacterized protein n=1 Tax=Dendrothele bispora (strain CBS 962.96) TaxID=1314807 RepID=A0A4S8LHS2_DENBC|nr:hypothetical protein K435DRAFT_969443 [Dendrothele bispora CBS 962.96]
MQLGCCEVKPPEPLLHVFGRNLLELLGRPSNTDLTDVSATLPEETFVDKEDVPERYLEFAVGSTRISCGVKRFVVCISTEFASEDRLLRECEVGNGLLEELEEWRYKLPEHSVIRAEDGRDDDGYSATRRRHRRAIGLLYVFWGYVRSILGRPFLLCEVNPELSRSPKSVLGILADLGRWELLEGLVGRLNAAAVSVNDGGRIERIHPNPEDEEDNLETLRDVLTMLQRIRLAPTYRILMDVAMQSTYIVGLREMETTASREESWNPNNGTSSLTVQSQSNTTWDINATGTAIAVASTDQL